MRGKGILLQQKAKVTKNSRYMFVKITKTVRVGAVRIVQMTKKRKFRKKVFTNPDHCANI